MSYKRATIFSLVFNLSILSAAVAQATVYWVHPSGSDSNSCATAAGSTPLTSQAKRTIMAGKACLSAGDTLYIRSRTGEQSVYAEILRGPWPTRTTLEGYQNENPIVRCNPGSLNTPGNCGFESENVAVAIVNNTSNITFRGFTFDAINMDVGLGTHGLLIAPDAPFTLIERMVVLNAVRGAFVIQADNVTVRNSRVNACGRVQPQYNERGEVIFDAKGSGIGSGNSNILVEHNVIENCRAVGITNMQNPNATNVIIRYNIVRNTGPFATGLAPAPWITTWSSSINVGAGNNIQVYGNLIYNAVGCLRVWGNAQNVRFYNNTCHNLSDVAGTDYPIQVDAGSTGEVRSNIVSGVSGGKQAIFGSGGVIQSNNLVNPPLYSTFINAAAGEFKLPIGSAAIDTGANVGPPYDRDLADVQRPQGCCYDIGAYEYLVSDNRLAAPILQIVP
jgi:hypothetical protein